MDNLERTGRKPQNADLPIGHKFQNDSLLKMALTHSSYANENKSSGGCSNERLEFLGDSVLGLIVSEYLYKNNPSMPEGELTRARAAIVCEQSLSGVARKLDLGRHLLLGRGEDASGGRTRNSSLADAVEAIIAAIFLDSGIEAARGFVAEFLLNGEKGRAAFVDYKTRLQEILQRDRDNVITYRMSGESGPDHAKVFSSQALVNRRVIGSGCGSSKKEAEQEAARMALEYLDKCSQGQE